MVVNHALFFKPVVAQSLDEVRYPFSDERDRQAARQFREDQIALDVRWRRSGFPASHQIASSIQY